MFEELNKRRQAVQNNIVKSFGIDVQQEEIVEKAEELDIEKGRAKKTFAVGDTFTRHGITYKCTGISANTGRPTWSRVKDDGDKKMNKEELDDAMKKIADINKREQKKGEEKKVDKNTGKYTKLDSRSSWSEIWDEAKKVCEEWFDVTFVDDEESRNHKDIFIKKKMEEICDNFKKSATKIGVISKINELRNANKEDKKKQESAVDEVMTSLKKLSDTYKDINKVSAFKMNNGDIGILYDGHSVATFDGSKGNLLNRAGIIIERDENEDERCAVEWTEFDKNDRLQRKRKEFKSQSDMRSFMKKLEDKDNFNEITATSGLKEDKEKSKKEITISSGEHKGKKYFIWKDGEDFKGSPEDPDGRVTNANMVSKFKSSAGFKSFADVEEYIKKYF